jgi:hypothetical protein
MQAAAAAVPTLSQPSLSFRETTIRYLSAAAVRTRPRPQQLVQMQLLHPAPIPRSAIHWLWPQAVLAVPMLSITPGVGRELAALLLRALAQLPIRAVLDTIPLPRTAAAAAAVPEPLAMAMLLALRQPVALRQPAAALVETEVM